MLKYLKLQREERSYFFQSKYNHYKRFNVYGVGFFCFAFIILYATDLTVTGSPLILSFFIRMLVLLPYCLLILCYRKIPDYRPMSVLSHFIAHMIIGISIFVTTVIPSQTAATANFLFMSFLLLIVSFSTPPSYTIVSLCLMIGEIFGIDSIFQFDNFELLLTYVLQILIMIIMVAFLVASLYYENYRKSLALDFMIYHDQLTQVYNRNKLEQIVNTDNNSLSCSSDKISILLVDIDHFKLVNDTYGHDSGDTILKIIANSIKMNVRNSDFVIRWGGEEFLILLVNCDLKAATEIGEHLRSIVEQLDTGICKITISIGVTFYQGGDYTKSVQEADQALYKAKENGRNQVYTYSNKFKPLSS